MNHRGANTATIPASNSHHGADSSSAGDPRELGKAKKYHGELLNLLDNLGGKLSVVSATVDKEFLASYRVHMLSVQSELRDLKNDVSKGEQMLNSDTQVAKLEKESKWFSDECARLKVHYDAMTKDNQQMRQRLSDMSEQRSFLCDQLKALLKRNKVLECEIQQIRSGGDSHSMSLASGSLAGIHNQIPMFSSQQSQPKGKVDLYEGRAQGEGDNVYNYIQNNEYIPLEADATGQLQSTLGHDDGNDPYEALDEDEYDDDKDDDNFHHMNSPKKLSVHSSSAARLATLPIPLQRAATSKRGDSLLYGANSPNPLSRSPSQRMKNTGNSASMPQLTRMMSQRQSSRQRSPPQSASSKRAKGREFFGDGAASPPAQYNVMSDNTHLHPLPSVLQKQQRDQYKLELRRLTQQRTPVELALEDAVRTIFQEVQARKQTAHALSATKRPTTGNNNHSADGSLVLGGQEERREGLNPPSGMPPILEPGSDGARLVKMVPTITTRGGITGLGTSQFSENDRFAAMVKFLAQPSVFPEVIERLRRRQGLADEVRAARDAGSPSGNGRRHDSHSRSHSRSRDNSPVRAGR